MNISVVFVDGATSFFSHVYQEQAGTGDSPGPSPTELKIRFSLINKWKCKHRCCHAARCAHAVEVCPLGESSPGFGIVFSI